jgi:hypothetical protein
VQEVMMPEAIGSPVSARVLRGDRWLDLELTPGQLTE